jgi:spore coat protein U-like protein
MTSLKRCFDARPGTACHRTLRVLRFATLRMAAAWLALTSQASLAAVNCTIAATPVGFGSYNVFAASPNDNGIGTLTIVCSGGGAGNYPVTLSTGQSGSYASRVMKSGANPLNYNLYTSAARSTIWGDGTGVSSSMTAARNATTNLSVYGRIPAAQDATVGTYADSITATVTF